MIRVAALALVLGAAAPNPAHAQDRRRVLAAALVAEASSTTDWAAILHVLQRRAERAGVTIEHMTKRYCAMWRKRTRRALRMRRLVRRPDARALAFVDSFFRGEVLDPCRGRALHWGGPMDSPSPRMVAVRCGRTQNTFYRVGRKRK